MEISNSNIKKILIFSEKKIIFLYFLRKSWQYFLVSALEIFSKNTALKKFLMFSQKRSYFFWKWKLRKKIVLIHEMDFCYISESNFPWSKFFYLFRYKEANFSKLKYLLKIINSHFFSFYNNFFYSASFLFPLLIDSCNVHDRIVGFLFCLESLFRKSIFVYSFIIFLIIFSW